MILQVEQGYKEWLPLYMAILCLPEFIFCDHNIQEPTRIRKLFMCYCLN